MNINRVICLICLSALIEFFIPQTSVAQNQLNPLEVEIDKSDPVIPLGYKKRKLSTFEINRIKREMEKLDRAARIELEQGKGKEAFELWYRQLKLARAVSIEAEVEALGKVGEIAWQANRGADLRNIANRLIAIESEIKDDNLSPTLLEQFAIAYQQVRYLPQAIAIHEQILARNRQSGLRKVEANLNTLGKLYLAQFDYQKAALTYEQLLTLAKTKSRIDPQIGFYLETLIDIYDRTKQKKQAIDTSQSLIANYEANGKQNKIPQLKLALADNHAALDNTARAIEVYEEAFTLAIEEQQLAISEEALNSLGKLYQTEAKPQLAIATLTRLLELQQQSYNHYGLINTYDALGKIHLKSAQKQQAKQYFQSALKLARELDYKVSYFNNRLNKL